MNEIASTWIALAVLGLATPPCTRSPPNGSRTRKIGAPAILARPARLAFASSGSTSAPAECDDRPGRAPACGLAATRGSPAPLAAAAPTAPQHSLLGPTR